jgi:hypothetical protein
MSRRRLYVSVVGRASHGLEVGIATMIAELDQIAAKLETLERTREGDVSILSRALVQIIREQQCLKARIDEIEWPEQTK